MIIIQCILYISLSLYHFYGISMEIEQQKKKVTRNLVVDFYQLTEAMEYSLDATEQILQRNPEIVHFQHYDKTLNMTITALYKAPSKEYARLLLKYGAKVNQENDKGLTPLDFVCLDKDIMNDVLAHYLIKHGANVNKRDSNDNNLLHRIIINNSNWAPYWIPFLTRFGARIDQRNNQNETPLDLAISTGKKIIQSFEKVGIKIYLAKNFDLFNPYTLLENNARQFKKITRDNNAQYIYGETLIAFLFIFIQKCQNKNKKSFYDKSFRKITTTSYGYVFNICSFKHLKKWVEEESVSYVQDHFMRQCAFAMYLAQKGKWEQLKTFLLNKTFVLKYDLDTACIIGKHIIAYADMLMWNFFRMYMPKNCIDKNGNSLLHSAVIKDKPKIVEDLIEKKCDFMWRNKEGKTAIDLAYELKRHDCVKAFYKTIYNRFCYNQPYQKLYGKTKQFLLTQYCINMRSKKGNSLLHKAVSNRKLGWCTWLLKNGSRINNKNEKDFSPLDLLLQNNNKNIDILSLLLRYGAIVTQEMIDNAQEPIKNMLQSAYDTLACCICFEHPCDINNIPCKNYHEHSFICKGCYDGIKNNQCPLCREDLEEYGYN